MRVRQWAEFGFSSETVEAHIITGMMGVEPDQFSVRGSRAQTPQPLPRFHGWLLRSGPPEQRDVDHLLGVLMQRVGPLEGAIREVLNLPDVRGGLQVVRQFEEGPEESSVVDPVRTVGGLERLGGQHPLLGFALDSEVLAFAARLQLTMSFDEYGPE
jgi:hypothetical protein